MKHLLTLAAFVPALVLGCVGSADAPTEECESGFHDGGDGVCVEEGACASNFVVGSGGRCIGFSVEESVPRAMGTHSSTLIPDGTVLVGGGARSGPVDAYNTRFFRYDPADGSWSDAESSRNSHGLGAGTVLLDTGRVLTASGFDGDSPHGRCETYDPASNTWTATWPMEVPRTSFAVAALSQGRAIAIGGIDESIEETDVVEVFDETTQRWSVTSPWGEANARKGMSTTVLENGDLLVTGGTTDLGSQDASDLVNRFDIDTESWSDLAPMPNELASHTATLLLDGRVLVVGGSSNGAARNFVFLYDPSLDEWERADSMRWTRYNHTAMRLDNGDVLIFGGNDEESAPSTQIYVAEEGRIIDGPSVGYAGHHAAMSQLDDGSILVTGGCRTIYDGGWDIEWECVSDAYRFFVAP